MLTPRPPCPVCKADADAYQTFRRNVACYQVEEPPTNSSQLDTPAHTCMSRPDVPAYVPAENDTTSGTLSYASFGPPRSSYTCTSKDTPACAWGCNLSNQVCTQDNLVGFPTSTTCETTTHCINPYGSVCTAQNTPHLGCMASGFDVQAACTLFWPGSTACYTTNRWAPQNGWSCNVGKGCPGQKFGRNNTLTRYCQSLGYKAARYSADGGWYCVDGSNQPVQPCTVLRDCSSCMHGLGCFWCASDKTCRKKGEGTCVVPTSSAACCNGTISECCGGVRSPSCKSSKGCPDCAKVTNDQSCCITAATTSKQATCPIGFASQGMCFTNRKNTSWKYKCSRQCL